MLRYVLIGIVIALAGLGIGYKWLMNSLDADYSRFYQPTSTAEARERGVLIAEIAAGVAKVWGDSTAPQMREAWAHAESHATHDWLFRRRLVIEDTTRICFTLVRDSPDPLREVGSTRYWWVDESGQRFHGSWTPESPVIWCRTGGDTIPARLDVTRVDRDSIAVIARRAIGKPLDALPLTYRRTGEPITKSGLRAVPVELLGLELLVFAAAVTRGPSNVVGVELQPRPSANERILLTGCDRASTPDALVLAAFNVGEGRVNRAWTATAAAPILAEIPPDGVVCTGPELRTRRAF